MNFSANIEQDRYLRAKRQVKKIKGFYIHATIYTIFSSIFIWLNFNGSNFPWAIFPVGGWGLGLLGHASNTFEHNIFFGKDWEQRKISELMNKER